MKVIFCLAVTFTLLSTNLHGDIVAYSNLGPNDEFSLVLPYLLGDNGSSAPDTQVAYEFTSQASGFVSSIDVAVGLSFAASGDALEIVLWTDGGVEPGTEIWVGATNPQFVSEVRSVTSSETFELIDGETYWVSGRSRNATGRYLWYRNSTGAFGRVNSDFDGSETWGFPGNGFEQTAFRVNVAEIPEPTAISAILISSLFLLRQRIRKS